MPSMSVYGGRKRRRRRVVGKGFMDFIRKVGSVVAPVAKGIWSSGVLGRTIPGPVGTVVKALGGRRRRRKVGARKSYRMALGARKVKVGARKRKRRVASHRMSML
jgi:hypothetical protein